MSDEPFPEQPQLMGPVRARNIARLYKALADQFAEAGDRWRAGIAMRDSQWWLAYSVSLQQTPPGKVDPW